jgi:hypothetical protein
MKVQVRKAEQGAGVKSSRLLRKLLKLSSDTRNLKKAEIVELANLYRCVHKDNAKFVVWIRDDEDAQLLAKKLGFLVPDLRAPESDVSDVNTDDGSGSSTDTKGETEAGAFPIVDESNVMQLKAEVQALKRRLVSLDEGVADLDTAVPKPVDRDDTSATVLERNRPETSNACILL